MALDTFALLLCHISHISELGSEMSVPGNRLEM